MKKAAVRRVRPSVVVSATLISCLGLAAAPVANADGPVENVRNAVLGARNNSLCNPLQPSGELEGYAQEWVRTARALDTRNTPTFPGAAYKGQTLQWIASGDPTSTAINELMAVATGDVQKCGFYQYGVGMSRDDITEKSFVAVILGKPDEPKPNPGPPKIGLPPAPAEQQPPPQEQTPPKPLAPAQPKATVKSDVDVYSQPGGEGSPVGILRQDEVVDFWGCIEEQWCHVTGAAVPNGDGWVWGEFLQR
ncbi:SH3 domain-containing protein [Mycolicibacterium stellerae]|uniref:SH3 domain-containing protein n=1 Tax=Mycolicibacterium stellerae TaxID=2358193 RepID=UPI000F0B0AA3|nr:SH3 domain-containing protein [Mycolicibacterium stellerae]